LRHIIVAVANDRELASRLGKLGATNGISFYNRKTDSCTYVAIAPSSPAEKFNSVAETISAAKTVIINAANIDKLFAESIIGASLIDRKIIIVGPDPSAMLKEFGIEYECVGEEGLLSRLDALAASDSCGAPIVDIDRAFNVKGVGVVVLGVVREGNVAAHDTLYSSDGKGIVIRSIQVQDDDVESAGAGSRVGLAVKGGDANDFRKGDVLSKTLIPHVASIEASIRMNTMVKEKGFDYKELWLVSGFRSSICTVGLAGNDVRIQLQSKLALRAGDAFLLVRRGEPRIFAGGLVK
jgi:selenocysteine-specific translation elongation factor